MVWMGGQKSSAQDTQVCGALDGHAQQSQEVIKDIHHPGNGPSLYHPRRCVHQSADPSLHHPLIPEPDLKMLRSSTRGRISAPKCRRGTQPTSSPDHGPPQALRTHTHKIKWSIERFFYARWWCHGDHFRGHMMVGFLWSLWPLFFQAAPFLLRRLPTATLHGDFAAVCSLRLLFEVLSALKLWFAGFDHLQKHILKDGGPCPFSKTKMHLRGFDDFNLAWEEKLSENGTRGRLTHNHRW